MAKKQTGRAIVHFSYRSQSQNKTFNSVLLGLERLTGKYSLPGGQFDKRKDKDTLATAIRELEEEFGISALRNSAQYVYSFDGHVCSHDIYVVQATGKLNLDKKELKGIGFFNAGRHNQIPRNLLERHVQALISNYFGSKSERKISSKIIIPGFYFTGNKDPQINDWITQRKDF